MTCFTLRNCTKGTLLATYMARPRGFWERNLGLLVRSPLREGEALWLDPGGGIHTWGLRVAIDVLFLDGERRVLGVAGRVRPWRMVFAPRGTRSVVELPEGAGGTVEPGDRLEMTEGRG